MTKDEALRLALEALDCIFASTHPYRDDGSSTFSDKAVSAGNEAITAIKQALEQPDSKPVECMCGICKLGKREWQGLTDEEFTNVQKETPYTQFMSASEYARDCQIKHEAKLKDKNHD